jgi:hypothetical protein
MVNDKHLHRVVAPLRQVLLDRARPGACHGEAHAKQYAGDHGQYLAGEGPSLRPFRGVAPVAEVRGDLAHLTLQVIQPLPGDVVQLLPGQPAVAPGRMPRSRNHLVDVLRGIGDLGRAWSLRNPVDRLLERFQERLDAFKVRAYVSYRPAPRRSALCPIRTAQPVAKDPACLGARLGQQLVLLFFRQRTARHSLGERIVDMTLHRLDHPGAYAPSH